MHTNLETQIDQFLSQVMQFAENKHEILLGKCQSDIKLTSTQEHLLMLLNGEPTTNARMAETLSVSPAAITKALKKLQDLELISPTKSKTDERVVLWNLTEKALPIAREHAAHHEATLDSYQQLTQKYTEDEQKVIQDFLHQLAEKFK
ncbi:MULTISPECIES: zinc-dependent MarR family transcriptional regulator [Lactococcus]|jgi:Transcriptional regulators|uniref:Zinc-dependent MarR family transcriptional regulator n=1 Tax=Lactococcus formosensis TaxID=1281486 RepID=A0A9X4P2T1_9LACT|nr:MULTISPECIES: zinc-dependent MarR family transcriptional regulator [Lactococcus]NHI67278.1 MarR family transcriptional regulator [Lactococcus garvieae]MCH1722736.1 zinc-dependent MarR family transcriptional regulator [Lactococcus formosensis]MCO7179867.1 zinc-dependent MarR family transcriptional regulator [Lactococcus formosensis]MDG6111560.1 zinc-dependent MarR family transcriptional regulator [Lactococcus formosensis]MDG6113113.1 zinc-dependent MarR family transcriptional regulator [Lact